MKIFNLIFYWLLSTSLITASLAEEKKIKIRGNNSLNEFKPLQITISPDLLNVEKALELKTKYKVAKEFAIKTDQNSKKKKKLNIEVLQKQFTKIMLIVLFFYITQLKEKKV